MSDPIRTTGKYGVELTEYKGEYGLTATYEDKSGKHWQQWGKRKIGKSDYAEKDSPIKIVLGDRKTAVAVLQLLLKQVLGEDSAIPPTDDEPF